MTDVNRANGNVWAAVHGQDGYYDLAVRVRLTGQPPPVIYTLIAERPRLRLDGR
jgi:hypothetical protein